MNKTGEHLQATADQGSSKREPLYRLSQVEKTYQQKGRTVKALRGVDLEIMPGELVVIQGTTGGGKSTLLQMLGALDRPTAAACIWPDGISRYWVTGRWRTFGPTTSDSSSSTTI